MNVNLLFGPMLIGVFLNMILYGILIMQAFIYYQTYKNDSTWLRYFVLYLFVVETLNTGFDIGIMYEPLILRYGTPEATKYFPTLFVTEPVCVVAVATPVQIFIAWRLLQISRARLVPALIAAFALASLGGGIWTAVRLARVRVFARKPELHAPALVWFAAACAADVAITVALVRTLLRRKTGFADTDDAIDRIIRITVQTGMVTALAAVGDVVFFLVLPHAALNFVWDLALSKLYSNSLMSTLNARAGWGNLARTGGAGSALFGHGESAASAGPRPADTWRARAGRRSPGTDTGLRADLDRSLDLDLDLEHDGEHDGDGGDDAASAVVVVKALDRLAPHAPR